MQSLHIVVRQELEKLHIESYNITLGEVNTDNELSEEQLAKFGNSLVSLGFDLLNNSKQQLIEKIRNIIVKQVH